MRIMLIGRDNPNELNGELALHNAKYDITSTADGPSRGVHKCATRSQKDYQMILML